MESVRSAENRWLYRSLQSGSILEGVATLRQKQHVYATFFIFLILHEVIEPSVFHLKMVIMRDEGKVNECLVLIPSDLG